jgi:hypothetical protein
MTKTVSDVFSDIHACIAADLNTANSVDEMWTILDLHIAESKPAFIAAGWSPAPRIDVQAYPNEVILTCYIDAPEPATFSLPVTNANLSFSIARQMRPL